MSHPPFPKGATGPEIQVIERIHRAADRHREPEVREALSGALDLIVGLIEDRGRRRTFGDQWAEPHDGG